MSWHIYILFKKKFKQNSLGGGDGYIRKTISKVGSFEDNVASKKDKYLRIFQNLCIGWGMG